MADARGERPIAVVPELRTEVDHTNVDRSLTVAKSRCKIIRDAYDERTLCVHLNHRTVWHADLARYQAMMDIRSLALQRPEPGTTHPLKNRRLSRPFSAKPQLLRFICVARYCVYCATRVVISRSLLAKHVMQQASTVQHHHHGQRDDAGRDSSIHFSLHSGSADCEYPPDSEIVDGHVTDSDSPSDIDSVDGDSLLNGSG